MSLEKFQATDGSLIPVGNYISIIYRAYSAYLNHKLENLNLNQSQLHCLFEIKYNSEINQERIASHCNMNKGAVARSIRKLEDDGLIIRKIDNNNRRQNKISLTEKGEKCIEESMKIIDDWENEVLKKNDIDEAALKSMLKDVAVSSITMNR